MTTKIVEDAPTCANRATIGGSVCANGSSFSWWRKRILFLLVCHHVLTTSLHHTEVSLSADTEATQFQQCRLLYRLKPFKLTSFFKFNTL